MGAGTLASGYVDLLRAALESPDTDQGVTLPDHIDDARKLIQSRLADIDAEVERLRPALASLGERGTPGRRHAGRRGASATAKPATPKRRGP